MHGRLFIVTAGALTMSSTAAAEPSKAPPIAAAAGPVRPARVELASVDVTRSAAVPGQPDAQSAKRPRAMRVTTCRCGAPRPEPESQREP
jgi:hypothetical protein